LVLGVDLAALAIPSAFPGAISLSSLTTAGLLALLSIAYSALSHTWERARWMMWEGRRAGHHRNFLATWCFVAAVILPPLLAAGVIITSMAAEWPGRSISKQAKLYRYVYSAASAILVACAVGRCADLPLPGPTPIVVGAAVYLVAGIVPVISAQFAVGQRRGFNRYFRWEMYRIEVYTISIGIGEVLLIQADLQAWVWLSLPLAIFLQRWTIRSEIRTIDSPVTLPMAEQAWLAVSREVIRACPVGAIMRIQTTDPAAASYLAKIKAGCDAVGMAGRSGLAVLLTQCPSRNADALAERMRAILQAEGVVAQVAVAAKPRDGECLDDLLAVSEAELIARTAASRPAVSDLEFD
jgi:hypothetical protein